MKITVNYHDDFINEMRCFTPEIDFDSKSDADAFAFNFLKELFKVSIDYEYEE